MTSTLRDRLAAVLGPGNDDTTAYAQADAVLDVLLDDITSVGDALSTPFGDITPEQRQLFHHPLMAVAGKSIAVGRTFVALENWVRS